MKVHLIRKETVETFTVYHAGHRPSFSEWLNKIRYADWQKPGDIKATFPSADLLRRSSNRVVFDIAGNNYRLICKYAFGDRQVHLFVCWIGTHAEYSKLCSDELQYSVSMY
jgi:mRNA interferase HigB